MHRALQGLRHKRARFFDPRIQTDPLIVLERRVFREAQRQDPLLRADRLLFFDESNFRQSDQQRWGWGTTIMPARIARSKGMMPTYNAMASVGIE